MNTAIPVPDRILSVDFFRGFTMFLLVANYGELFNPESANSMVAAIGRQLDHVNWSGLAAWDLIQPFFMFIVGVSMPFSFAKKWAKGDSWNKTFFSALRRSALLLVLGWAISSGETFSAYTNVLAQLSVTYLVAFLLMKKPVVVQLLVSFALILFTDLIYHFWSVPGFDQAFTADHNFGSWLDIQLAGRVSEDRWVAFNAIPTSAHTIWGVLAGKLLMNEWPARKKIAWMVVPGIVAMVAGYALHPFIPIIKRTCTSSFILVSGGWCLVALAFSYWLIDIKKQRKLGFFFAVVGMNPLFIYLFVHSGGKDMITSVLKQFTYRLLSWAPEGSVHVANVLIVSAILWYICYFMYKKKVFIRI